MSAYKVFISGETIDLCVPSKLAIEKDNWTDWFNDSVVCENLYRGVFPHFESEQYEFLDSLKNKSRFAVMIKPKKIDKVIGVISLSSIEFERRSAQISIVIGDRTAITGSLAALEAMALVTEHGFEQLGLDRIWAGQAYPEHSRMIKFLELLAYRTEGISRKAFVKGRRIGDIANIACLYRNYEKLKNERNGAIWPGNTEIKKLIRQLPKKGFAEQLDVLLLNFERDYFGE